jgi:hypothetical protein
MAENLSVVSTTETKLYMSQNAGLSAAYVLQAAQPESPAALETRLSRNLTSTWKCQL